MKKHYICNNVDRHLLNTDTPYCCILCGGTLKQFISREDLKICIDAYLPEKIETEFDKGLVFLANRIINKIGAK